MNTYTLTIPFGRPHDLTGNCVPSGIKMQRGRNGWRVPIVRGKDHDPIGKTVHVDTDSGGLTFTIEIGDRHGEGYGYGKDRYYAHPIVARGQLLGLDINALTSWPDAQLRPATPDRKYPSVPPLPPQLDRLRHV